MRLFKAFRTETLKPAWRYDPGAFLWRILPAGEETIVGEARPDSPGSVRFFCLNTRTGRPLWEDRDFGLGWWCGIEGVSGGILYLHRFASPDLPVHKGVYAVDVRTGSQLWSAGDLRFVSMAHGVVLAEEDSLTETRVVELEAGTGRRRSAAPASGAGSVPGAPGPGDRDAMSFPVPLAVLEERAPGTSALVAELGGGAGEAILAGGMVIACTVVTSGGRSRNELMVIAGTERRVLYRDEVASGAVPVTGAFFMRGTMVMYVRNRGVLTGVNLKTGEDFSTTGADRESC